MHFLSSSRGVLGACAIVLIAALTGCASDSTSGSSASSNSSSYAGYSAGTGMSSQNVQSSSPLPGPRYYQSSDDPFHSN